MDSSAIEKLVMEVVKKETAFLYEEIENLKTEQKKGSEMIENLKTEKKKNGEMIENLKKEKEKLQAELTKVGRNLDEVEQYNRKSSLILGGAFPEGKEGESPTQTREVAMKIIKDKLKVNLKGGISACHRLKNKKRVIIKFQDLDDREAVYQAKFDQDGEWADKIAVHENLTEKRSKMVTLLEEMRKNKEIMNYYTRNGNIMARNGTEKQYSRIQPWYSVDEIRSVVQGAQLKSQGHNSFMRSQSYSQIPQGSVARKATNLEDYVVGQPRLTRQAKNSNTK